jgi:hypothetical protein
MVAGHSLHDRTHPHCLALEKRLGLRVAGPSSSCCTTEISDSKAVRQPVLNETSVLSIPNHTLTDYRVRTQVPA